MIILAVILSSLALFVAAAAVSVCLWERKRNMKRNAALRDAVLSVSRKLKSYKSLSDKYRDADVEKMEGRFTSLEDRVDKLETGAVPDYEKAKQAAVAVNDFNSGITGILGYDPYEALLAQRSKDRGGELIE